MIKMKNDRHIRIGSGLNPYHFNSEDKLMHLKIPGSAEFLEMGLDQFFQWQETNPNSKQEISLHIARSPITEDESKQDEYIAHLAKLLENINLDKVISFGFHLTGTRFEGIGLYGFSSHYVSDSKKESHAVRFISQIKKTFNKEVWLENANFYSESSFEMIESWKSMNRIVEMTNSKVILDLTHLYIDSMNLNVSPYVCFGVIPWDNIVELHLSGMVKGKDGALHDGHSMNISQEIWDFLENVLTGFSFGTKLLTLTIEHTDHVWINKKEAYYEDFLTLEQVIKERKVKSNFYEESSNYALGNMERLLSIKIPKLKRALTQRNLEMRPLLVEWTNVVKKEGKRIVFSKSEITSQDKHQTVYIYEEFLNYLKRRSI